RIERRSDDERIGSRLAVDEEGDGRRSVERRIADREVRAEANLRHARQWERSRIAVGDDSLFQVARILRLRQRANGETLSVSLDGPSRPKGGCAPCGVLDVGKRQAIVAKRIRVDDNLILADPAAVGYDLGDPRYCEEPRLQSPVGESPRRDR